MPTTEELISGLQSRILEIEQALTEMKKKPETPDRSKEIDALRAELTELRQELSETKKSGKPNLNPPITKGADDDLSAGFFS